MARASGGANNMRPLSWGGGGAQTEKIQYMLPEYTLNEVKVDLP